MIVLGGIYFVAVMAKTWQFAQVSIAIQYVLGVSASTALGLTVVLTLIEAGLGLALLFGVARRIVLFLTLRALIGLSFVLARLWLDPAAPSCGCLGFIRQTILGGSKSPLGLIRNCLMIWSVIWLIRVEKHLPAWTPRR